MKKNTHMVALLALLYGGTLLSVLVFGVYKIEVLGSEYEINQKIIAEQALKEKAYFDLVQIVDATKADREKIATFFITEKDTIRFITTIEQYARQQRVMLETTQLAVEPKKEKTEKSEASDAMLKIGFTFTGTEEAVKNMAAIFETLPYHKTISEFVLQQSEQGGWTGSILLAVTITP